MPDSTKQRRNEALVRLALFIPFLIGLTWTLCHPIVSIVTGELKCRGIFIDEHALDPLQYSTGIYSSSVGDGYNAKKLEKSLICERLDVNSVTVHVHHSLSCLSAPDFDIIKILPYHGTPVTIPTETIVLIIPSPPLFERESSERLLFETLLHQLIHRLHNSSWLAKTILVVIPRHTSNLTASVHTFLQAYLGGTRGGGVDYDLPPSFTMFLIRQLIVIDLYSTHSSTSTQIHVLSQGPRGLLPNLDLVFVTIQTIQQFLPAQDKVAMHPLDMTGWKKIITQQLQSMNKIHRVGSWWYQWGIELGDLGAFAATMMRGPYV